MANIDIAAGISQDAATELLGQYFAKPPSTNNPFVGQTQKDIGLLGTITLKWEFKAAPMAGFGPPSLDKWNRALGPTGKTNASTNTPLPGANTIQLIAPAFYAKYFPPPDGIGGTTYNMEVYVSMEMSNAGVITLTPLALLVSEADFADADKSIFNELILPTIFKYSGQILQPVQAPQITWTGVSLKTPRLWIENNYLLSAAVLQSNANDVDTQGATWPPGPAFGVVSTSLINEALTAYALSLDKTTFSGGKEYENLASGSFSGQLENVTASVKTLSPLVLNGSIEVDLQASADVNDFGLGQGLKNCPLTSTFL